MGIRLVVVDDNPHLAWDGRTHPANATFGQFLPAILEVPGPGGSPAVARIDHCVPVRAAASAPATLPLDARIRVVATAPFDGIAGYLRHAPTLLRRNAAILRPVIRAADLVWIKVPASNAPLAAALARAAGVPRFGYVAGSAAAVAGSQEHGRIGGAAARIVGAGYDLAGRLASLGGDRVVVGADLDGEGIVTSLVEPNEIRPGPARRPGRGTPRDFGSPGRVGSSRARGSRLSSTRSRCSPLRRRRGAGSSSSSSVTGRLGPRSGAARSGLGSPTGSAGAASWQTGRPTSTSSPTRTCSSSRRPPRASRR